MHVSMVRRHLLPWLLALAWLLVSAVVHGKEAAPQIRVEVEGSRPVRAGQQVRIHVTVLAPNFFRSPPPFPMFQMSGAIVTMPDERAVNSTETIDGVNYAGVRKTYLFVAQQGGDFVLPAAEIAFTYAGDDGSVREGKVSLPPTRIAVKGAAAEAGTTGPALPVARITITQRFDRSLDDRQAPIRAGDALVRTLDIAAEQAQAMMIPPPHAQVLAGVRVFAADPVLSDRGDPPGGHRIDRFTYVFERPGTYTLPAVSIAWIDPASGQPATSVAPAVRIEVARAVHATDLTPTVLFAGSTGDGTNWRLWMWLGALAMAGFAAWRLRAPCRRFAFALRAMVAASRAHRARRDSTLLDAAIAACRVNDAERAESALQVWTREAFGCGASIWANGAADDDARTAVDDLQRFLYGAGSGGTWNGDALRAALQRHRLDAHRRWVLFRRKTKLAPLNG